MSNLFALKQIQLVFIEELRLYWRIDIVNIVVYIFLTKSVCDYRELDYPEELTNKPIVTNKNASYHEKLYSVWVDTFIPIIEYILD